MNIAYADPPYLGQGQRRYKQHHVEAGVWDNVAGHIALIERLESEYPDGWAMSCSSPSLRVILPECPVDVRVAAWVKPFAVFKPNVNPAYAWEPVIWRGGRQTRQRSEPTVRDWMSANITLQKGLCGAKPEAFVWWLFALLGVEEHDTVTDIFPGTGVVERVWEQFQRQGALWRREEPQSVGAIDPSATGTGTPTPRDGSSSPSLPNAGG